jgi:hypothetical protein
MRAAEKIFAQVGFRRQRPRMVAVALIDNGGPRTVVRVLINHRAFPSL